MRFVDTHVFREQRFSLGTDMHTGRPYISLPVSGFNRAIEFEAHFSISDDEYRMFSIEPDAANDLVAAMLCSPNNARRIR